MSASFTAIEKLHQSVDYIRQKWNLKSSSPSAQAPIGVVLGSGLSSFGENLKEAQVIDYAQIPHFSPTHVEGHLGKCIKGKVQQRDVIVLSGRHHAYEGYSQQQVVHGVRTLGLLGVQQIILTNASGGINEHFHPGDIVLIKDHLNLSGLNPLTGKNFAELGPRFPDMSQAYPEHLRLHFKKIGDKHQKPFKEGVYCWLQGPTYETPAEIRMLKLLGADMVGMSTVPEVIAAHHMGLEVVGISCITNYAAGLKPEKLNHNDVKDVALQTMKNFGLILNDAIGHLPTPQK
jgi:purine-nucleoside phosphorylase